eukprot:350381-Chlamydomonas_euryale.AAC.3
MEAATRLASVGLRLRAPITLFYLSANQIGRDDIAFHHQDELLNWRKPTTSSQGKMQVGDASGSLAQALTPWMPQDGSISCMHASREGASVCGRQVSHACIEHDFLSEEASVHVARTMDAQAPTFNMHNMASQPMRDGKQASACKACMARSLTTSH